MEFVFKGERIHVWTEHQVDVAIELQGPVQCFGIDLNHLFVRRVMGYLQGIEVTRGQFEGVGFSAVALERGPQGVVLMNANAEAFPNNGAFDERPNNEFQLRTFIGFPNQLLGPPGTARDRENTLCFGIRGSSHCESSQNRAVNEVPQFHDCSHYGDWHTGVAVEWFYRREEQGGPLPCTFVECARLTYLNFTGPL